MKTPPWTLQYPHRNGYFTLSLSTDPPSLFSERPYSKGKSRHFYSPFEMVLFLNDRNPPGDSFYLAHSTYPSSRALTDELIGIPSKVSLYHKVSQKPNPIGDRSRISLLPPYSHFEWPALQSTLSPLPIYPKRQFHLTVFHHIRLP